MSNPNRFWKDQDGALRTIDSWYRDSNSYNRKKKYLFQNTCSIPKNGETSWETSFQISLKVLNMQ